MEGRGVEEWRGGGWRNGGEGGVGMEGRGVEEGDGHTPQLFGCDTTHN